MRFDAMKFLPYVLSFTVHALVVGILLFQFEPPKSKPKQQTFKQIIQTQTVSSETVKQHIAAYEKKQQRIQQKALEKQRRMAQAAKKKALALKQKEAARKKAEAEKKRKLAEAKRQAREKARQAAARKKQEADKKKRAAAAAAQKHAAQQQLQQQMAAEMAREAEKQKAWQYQQQLNYYRAIFKQKIEGSWRQPRQPRGLQCTIVVRLSVSGRIIDANIVQSSGHKFFDDSVLNAVYKAIPYDLPQEPELNKRLQRLTFTFSNG